MGVETNAVSTAVTNGTLHGERSAILIKPLPILHNNSEGMTIAMLKMCIQKQRNSVADKVDSEYEFRCLYQINPVIGSPQIRDCYIYLRGCSAFR
jgi:hypothetical protein